MIAIIYLLGGLVFVLVAWTMVLEQRNIKQLNKWLTEKEDRTLRGEIKKDEDTSDPVKE